VAVRLELRQEHRLEPMKRIVLLNPPSPTVMVREGRCMQRRSAWTTVWPPVTLATLGAMLTQKGHDVRLWDCSVSGMDAPRYEEELRAFRPDVVVINTATGSIAGDAGSATAAKAANPSARTIAIGIHPSALPAETLGLCPDLDAVCVGEPEQAVVDWAESDGAGARGIVSRANPGAAAAPLFIRDLDSLPFPDWGLVDLSRYRLPFSGRRFLLVDAGRGCPFGCTFCAAKTYYGSQPRRRSARRVYDEAVHNRERYGVRDLLFWSESFTYDAEFVRELCALLIDSRAGIRWVCNSRVDRVTPQLLSTMKRAGCWMVGYGIESFNQQILDECKKGVTTEQIEMAVAWAREAGLQVTAHCILGLPGETTETMRNTERFLHISRVDFVQFYTCVPFPGSPLYSWAENEDRLLTRDFSRFEQNSSVLRLDTISNEEIERFRRAAYRRFYLQPHVILNVLRASLSLSGAVGLLRAAVDFITWH